MFHIVVSVKHNYLLVSVLYKEFTSIVWRWVCKQLHVIIYFRKCLYLAAIQYYRKAVQLVPDIEFKVDEFRPIRRGNCFSFSILTHHRIIWES